MSLRKISQKSFIDATWDDYYSENSSSSVRSLSSENENYVETLNSTVETIQSHMLEQINLPNITEQDRFWPFLC